MRIAVDFDGTFTANESLWFSFIAGARATGHDVKFVTFRHADYTAGHIMEWAKRLGIEVIFTCHTQKAEYCEKIGWKPDIWVDDEPVHIPSLKDMSKRVKKILDDEDDEDDRNYSVNIHN